MALKLDKASLVEISEQSYRARPSQREIQARPGTMLGLTSFASAAITIPGVKLMHRIRKEQFDSRALATQGQTTREIWAALLAA